MTAKNVKTTKLSAVQIRHLNAAAWTKANPSGDYGAAVEPAYLTWYRRDLFGELTHSTFISLVRRGLVTQEQRRARGNEWDSTVYLITPAGFEALRSAALASAAADTNEEAGR